MKHPHNVVILLLMRANQFMEPFESLFLSSIPPLPNNMNAPKNKKGTAIIFRTPESVGNLFLHNVAKIPVIALNDSKPMKF